MKQIGLKKVRGKIVVKTGLHIGSGYEKSEIGAMDNPIVRNPVTREPYIPGSSIKGKLRSLSEWRFERIQLYEGDPCKCGDPECPVCRVFGSGNSGKREDRDKARERGPTRVIVRDAFLSKEDVARFREAKPIIEEKSENCINRITAQPTMRSMERVVPGVAFDFELSYRIIDTGDGGELDRKYFYDVIIGGLRLLKNDYLGGGGSRGNGSVDFVDLKDETGTEISL